MSRGSSVAQVRRIDYGNLTPDLDLVVIAAGDEPVRLSIWLCRGQLLQMLTMAASCESQRREPVRRVLQSGR